MPMIRLKRSFSRFVSIAIVAIETNFRVLAVGVCFEGLFMV
jgi:hypothetical protein